MKIAIVGAHRVGKTTLAEELLEHLPGYHLYREPYYEMEESGYVFSEMPDVDDFAMQFEHAVKQLAGEEQNVISDRSPIDILAYIHALDQHKDIRSLFETAQETMADTDLVVFVPIEEPDVISGAPDLPKLRSRVNDILIDWVWDVGVEVIEVSGSLPDRREQVLTILNRFSPPA